MNMVILVSAPELLVLTNWLSGSIIKTREDSNFFLNNIVVKFLFFCYLLLDQSVVYETVQNNHAKK